MKHKSLSHRDHRNIDRDYRKTARAAHLIYVSAEKEGICRHKNGKGYIYTYRGKKITADAQLDRIRRLAIPPSWTQVWICPHARGHIQATGTDLNKRKQYKYHEGWNALRNETKFHRLYEFGKALPKLRRALRRDMADPTLSASRVIATVITLMQHTYIRVGNNDYEKRYGSYGLTTLKDKHVEIKKDTIRFCFHGKKGIIQEITLRHPRLARLVKQCRDIPGKELFQYYDQQGRRKSIDSGMINQYIREAAGNDFSAKDFRTWAGSLHALDCLLSQPPGQEETARKKALVEVFDTVSKKLGNTRNICKKYYVHPGLISLYEEDRLSVCLSAEAPSKAPASLTKQEKLLLHILQHCC